MLAKIIRENGLELSDFRRISEDCSNYRFCEDCPDKEICEMVDTGSTASDWNEEDFEEIDSVITLVEEMMEYCDDADYCNCCPFYVLCSEMNNDI